MGGLRPLCADRRSGRAAVFHLHPAAERHRRAAHGPCPQQHFAGRADPLRADARKAALWTPGTDHAGIATQMVVERQLAESGNISRRDMGREAFVEKVWQWKAESGGTIVN